MFYILRLLYGRTKPYICFCTHTLKFSQSFTSSIARVICTHPHKMSRVVIEKPIFISADSQPLPTLIGLKISRLSTKEIVDNGVADVLKIELPPPKGEYEKCNHVQAAAHKVISFLRDDPESINLLGNGKLPPSALSIAYPTNISTGKPMHLLAQLNNRFLGSTSYRQSCDTCLKTNYTCRGHGTCHRFYWPLLNVNYTSTIICYLQRICHFCSRLRSRRFEDALRVQLPNNQDYANWNINESTQWCVRQRAHLQDVVNCADYNHTPLICEQCGLPQPVNYKLIQPDLVGVFWDFNFVNIWRKNHMNSFVIGNWMKHALDIVMGVNGFANKITSVSEWLHELSLLPPTLGDQSVSREQRHARIWLERASMLIHPKHWAEYVTNSIYTAGDVRLAMELIDNETVWLLGHDPRTDHPMDMIWTHLPIVTRSIRPQSVDVESSLNQTVGGMKKTQDVLTRTYECIVTISGLVRKALIDSKHTCLLHLKSLAGAGTIRTPEIRWQIRACAQWANCPLHDMWRLTCETRVGAWAAATFLLTMPAEQKLQKRTFLQQYTNLQYEVNLMINSAATMKRNKLSSSDKHAFLTSDTADGGGGDSGSTVITTSVEEITPSRRHNTGRVGAGNARISNNNNDGSFGNKSNVAKKPKKSIDPEVRVKAVFVKWADAVGLDVKQEEQLFAPLKSYSSSSILKCPCCIKSAGKHGVYWHDNNDVDKGLSEWMRAIHTFCANTTTTTIIEITQCRLNFFVDPITHTFSNQKIPPGILQRQSTKKGIILDNLTAKRCDWSARLVISANNRIRVGTIHLPTWVAISQTKLVVVNKYNLRELLECVRRGANRIGGAAAVITNDNRVIWFKKPQHHATDNSTTVATPAVLLLGWQVLVYLQKGDFILVNRQPTLQKASCNAHAVDMCDPTLVPSPFEEKDPWANTDSDTASISECSTDPYNGDFDGDVMAMTIQQQISSRVEAAFMMNIANTYICPRTHQPIFKLKQSTLLGCYLLCQEDAWLTHSEAVYLHSQIRGFLPRHLKHVGHRTEPERQANFISNYDDCYTNHYRDGAPRYPVALPSPANLLAKQWSGRQIISLIFPHDFTFNKGDVVIQHGVWVKGSAAKATFNGANSIFHHLWLYYSKQYAIDAQSECGLLGSVYLEKIRGFTCGLDDLEMGAGRISHRNVANNRLMAEMARTKILNSINYAFAHLSQAITQHHDELCDAQIRMLYNHVQAKSERGSIVMSDLHLRLSEMRQNHVLLMSSHYAGSKGSVPNAATISGAVGYQKSQGLPLGNELDSASRRTTKHAFGERTADTAGMIMGSFARGLSAIETFSSNQVNRPAIYDSSDLELPGYQQKRFNKHAGSETVANDGTIRNSPQTIIQLCFGGDGYDPVYSTRIKLSAQILSGALLQFVRTTHLKTLLQQLAHVFLAAVSGRPYHKFKSTRDFCTSGYDCLVSVNVQDYYNQFTAVTTQEGGVEMDEQTLYDFVNHEIMARTLATCTPIEFQLHVLDVCLTNWHIKHRPLSQNDFTHMLQKCADAYSQRMFEPGSSAGANMAQNIAEPAAQIKLRTFNPVATTEGGLHFVSDGLTQFHELSSSNHPRTEANNVSTVTLDPRWVSTNKAAKLVENSLASCMLNQLVHTGHIHTVDLTASDNVGANTTVGKAHPLWPALFGAILGSYPSYTLSQVTEITAHPVITFELKEMACFDRFAGMGTTTTTSAVLETERVLRRGLLPFQRALMIGGPSIADNCPYYWCIWMVYTSDDLTQWLSSQQVTAIWSQHITSLRDLARTLYTTWRVLGEAGIERCIGHMGVTEPTNDVTHADDIIPSISTATPPYEPQSTIELFVGHWLDPNHHGGGGGSDKSTTTTKSDLLWTRRIWPNLLKQLEQRHILLTNGNGGKFTVTYVDNPLRHLPANGEKDEFEHALGAQVHIAAVIKHMSTNTFEVIVLLKSAQTLVREGWLRSQSNMVNVGIQLPRNIIGYFGRYNNVRLVQIVSEFAYTDQLYNSYLTSLEYYHDDAKYKIMFPFGVDYAVNNIRVELWHAKEFYYDWWNHSLRDEMEVLLPFTIANEETRKQVFSQRFGRAVGVIQDLDKFTSALPVFHSYGPVSRRLGVLGNNTIVFVKRSNCPKVNMLSARRVNSR